MPSRVMRFECQPGCTNCCTQQGFVYLTAADLERIAEFLGMAAAEFERKYVFRTKHLLRLRVPRASHCRFLREGGCAIHAVKPTQCRIFPHWPELVGSAREWCKAARYCPGIGQGELVNIEAARAAAEEMQAAYPGLYKSV